MKKRSQRGYTMGARADDMVATRERIVRATVELALVQAYEEITLAAIAAAAGVSHQTVLNYFQSKEGVAAAAAEVIAHETEAARAVAVPGDTGGAIGILLGEYERIGDAGVRWAMAADRLGALAGMLESARTKHQAWLERIFAARLPNPAAARRRTIHALHVATDLYTWKLLRRDLRLDREETKATIVGMVGAVLAGLPSPRPRPSGGRR